MELDQTLVLVRLTGNAVGEKNAERGVEYQQPEPTNVIESPKRHIAGVRALTLFQLWTMSNRMVSSLEHISWQSAPLFEIRIAQERLRSCLNWL